MTRTSSVLTDEIQILQMLIDLADQKRTALFDKNLASLQQVVEEEEVATKRLSQLEETRLQQAGLFTTDDEAHRMERETMRQLLQILKTKNEFNQTILNDAVAYTRYSLQLFFGMRQTTAVYGAEGKLEGTGYRRIIDRKG